MRVFKNKFDSLDFRTVYFTDKVEAAAAIKNIPTDRLLGIDLETAKHEDHLEHPQAGLCPHLSSIRLVQIYDDVKKVSYVFDIWSVKLDLLRNLFSKGRFVAHYAVFEIKHLTHAGFPDMNIGCSMLLSQMTDQAEHSPFEVPEEEIEDEEDEDQTGLSRYKKKSHGLDALTQRLFGVRVEKLQQKSDWNKPVLDVEQITYAGLDAVLTYKCATELAKKLVQHKMGKAYQLVKDMQHVVARMELNGLPVDWKYHEKLIAEWGEKSEAAKKKCKPFFGDTNMGSGKQMNEWLLKYLKKDPITLARWPRTNKCKCEKIGGKLVRPCECGAPFAFGKTQVTPFKHLPAIDALLEYKKWAKLISTYGESLVTKRHPITDCIHPSYVLGDTRTGRLSSKNPNAQNFPREVEFRNIFCAPKGYVLVVSDFSQIELRLQAEFSQDPIMLKAYKDDEDIYKKMASFMFGVPPEKVDKKQRFAGKTVMLALGYGMGPTKLEMYANNAGAEKHPSSFWMKAHKTYHTTFRVYSQWCEKMRARAKQLGYIETLMGKRRKLTEGEIYTAGPNTVIQGTAAELMKRASIICKEKKGNLIGNFHDEILLIAKEKEADKAKTILADSMNQAMKELFPKAASLHVADAAYAARWGEAKAEL